MAADTIGTQISQDDLLRINTMAGAKLLAKNQLQWHEMHSKSEKIVEKSKLLKTKFNVISINIEQRRSALGQLLDRIKGLNDIEMSITEVSRDLDRLFRQFEDIESNLVVLQNAKEQADVIRFKEAQNVRLKDFTDNRTKEFERTCQRLDREHQERVRDYEQKQESLMEERRRLHEQAFQEEMQRYLANNRNT